MGYLESIYQLVVLIACFGLHSKFSLFKLVKSAQMCEKSYECFNSTIIDNLIECTGYQSCSHCQSLNATNVYISCRGSYSCSNVNTMYALVSQGCQGFRSCANTNSIQTQELLCQGELSCTNTNIGNNNNNNNNNVTTTTNNDINLLWLDCPGHKSCANTSILNNNNDETLTIDVTGSLSITDSIITTSTSTSTGGTVNAYFSGYYSGLNSMFTCGSGHKCNIECNGFGCNNLTLINENNNNTNISINCNSSNVNSICPNGYSDDYLANITLSRLRKTLAFETYLLNSIDSNNFCENVSIATSVNDAADSYFATVINNDNNGIVCCNSEVGCQFSPNISLINNNGNSIRCDGELGCKFATITVYKQGNVICGARNGCRESVIKGVSDKTSVFCSGVQSCLRIDQITNVLHVICAGDSSCESAAEISNINQNVYGLGEESLIDAVLTNIGGNVYCLAKLSCPGIIITTADSIYGNGYQSLYEATINNIENELFVTGYEAMQYATIINSSSVSIYINGDYGLHGTKIYGSSKLVVKGINTLSDTIIHSPSDGSIIEIVIDSNDNDEYWIICNTTDICYIDFTDNSNSDIDESEGVATICCFGECFINGIETSPYDLNCPLIDKPVDNSVEKELDNLATFQRYLLGVLASVSVILAGLAAVEYVKRKSSTGAFDRPSFEVTLKVAQNLADFVSDILFCITMYITSNNILFFLSGTFILIPHSVSCFIGFYTIGQWNQAQSEKLEYYKKYNKILYVLIFIIGFYRTVDLTCSKIFYLNVTNLQLKRREYEHLQYFRLFNVLCLENIPQLMIECYYLAAIDSTNEIALVSITFTLISFIVALLVRLSTYKYHSNLRRKYSHKAKIFGQFSIECEKIRREHLFSNKLLARCIDSTLDENYRIQYKIDKLDARLVTQVHHIDKNASSTGLLNVDFDIAIYTHNEKDNDLLVKLIAHSTFAMMNVESVTKYNESATAVNIQNKAILGGRSRSNSSNHPINVSRTTSRERSLSSSFDSHSSVYNSEFWDGDWTSDTENSRNDINTRNDSDGSGSVSLENKENKENKESLKNKKKEENKIKNDYEIYCSFRTTLIKHLFFDKIKNEKRVIIKSIENRFNSRLLSMSRVKKMGFLPSLRDVLQNAAGGGGENIKENNEIHLHDIAVKPKLNQNLNEMNDMINNTAMKPATSPSYKYQSRADAKNSNN